MTTAANAGRRPWGRERYEHERRIENIPAVRVPERIYNRLVLRDMDVLDFMGTVMEFVALILFALCAYQIFKIMEEEEHRK